MYLDPTPFDGEPPEKYPETYRELLQHRCFKQKPEVEHYFSTQSLTKVICSACYRPNYFRNNEQVDVYVSWYLMAISTEFVLFCDICRKILLNKQNVIKYRRCTEAVLQFMEKANSTAAATNRN